MRIEELESAAPHFDRISSGVELLCLIVLSPLLLFCYLLGALREVFSQRKKTYGKQIGLGDRVFLCGSGEELTVVSTSWEYSHDRVPTARVTLYGKGRC